jgi:uncharacterized ferritin-like protein (DUF455 family)
VSLEPADRGLSPASGVRGGLFAASRHCLALADPAAKCAAVATLHSAHRRGRVATDPECPVEPIGPPGRPDRPCLVDASRVPRRRLGSAEGRSALVHAIAHIEFNAINLALDAVYRFRGMPAAYYADWLSVAADEARHFQLLQERLRAMGRSYGDFPAHNGLWEMAEKTADSCLVRMALVPRVLEARGLDVTPGMIERLAAAGDPDTVVALRVILAEEVRHVAIGTHWFRYCCEQEGLEPSATFLDLLERRYAGAVRGPFNLEARYAAGFTEEEMAALEAL